MKKPADGNSSALSALQKQVAELAKLLQHSIDAHTAAIHRRDERIETLTNELAETRERLDLLHTAHDARNVRISGIEERAGITTNAIMAAEDAVTEVKTLVDSLQRGFDGLRDACLKEVAEQLDEARAASNEQFASVQETNKAAADGFIGLTQKVADLERGLQAIERIDVSGRFEDVDVVNHATNERIEGVSASTSEAIANIQTMHNAHRQAIAGEVQKIEGALSEMGDSLARLTKEVDDAGAKLHQRLDDAHGAINEVEAEGEQTKTRIGAIEARHRHDVQALTDHIRETVSALPKSLMIRRDGELLAISGRGEAVALGNVAGRDGRDAPAISRVQLLNGCLVIAMSDGRDITVPNVLQYLLQEVQDEQIRNLSKQQLSDTQIAERVGVNRKRVQKVLGDDVKASTTPAAGGKRPAKPADDRAGQRKSTRQSRKRG